jgi:hypothetical protein
MHRPAEKSQRHNGRGGRSEARAESCVTKDRVLNETYQRIGNRPPGSDTEGFLYIFRVLRLT